MRGSKLLLLLGDKLVDGRSLPGETLALALPVFQVEGGARSGPEFLTGPVVAPLPVKLHDLSLAHEEGLGQVALLLLLLALDTGALALVQLPVLLLPHLTSLGQPAGLALTQEAGGAGAPLVLPHVLDLLLHGELALEGPDTETVLLRHTLKVVTVHVSGNVTSGGVPRNGGKHVVLHRGEGVRLGSLREALEGIDVPELENLPVERLVRTGEHRVVPPGAPVHPVDLLTGELPDQLELPLPDPAHSVEGDGVLRRPSAVNHGETVPLRLPVERHDVVRDLEGLHRPLLLPPAHPEHLVRGDHRPPTRPLLLPLHLAREEVTLGVPLHVHALHPEDVPLSAGLERDLVGVTLPLLDHHLDHRNLRRGLPPLRNPVGDEVVGGGPLHGGLHLALLLTIVRLTAEPRHVDGGRLLGVRHDEAEVVVKVVDEDIVLLETDKEPLVRAPAVQLDGHVNLLVREGLETAQLLTLRHVPHVQLRLGAPRHQVALLLGELDHLHVVVVEATHLRHILPTVQGHTLVRHHHQVASVRRPLHPRPHPVGLPLLELHDLLDLRVLLDLVVMSVHLVLEGRLLVLLPSLHTDKVLLTGQRGLVRARLIAEVLVEVLSHGLV
eukprot:Hpha_TRINITY_DN15848_c4_g9::TRINITY_DN15848_c4_g9_i1::g.189024::m.189024